ncbi:MAG: M3 family metallopeptidase [Acidiferrobacteraceae bacterium]|jgi:oligopeptidase A
MAATDSRENPLLDLSGPPRFSAIRPEHVTPALDAVLAEAGALRERLLDAGPPWTWDRFVQPLEDMNERVHRVWSPVSHLNSVCNSEELRQVYQAGLLRLSEYATDLAQDERIYEAYRAIADGPEYERLETAQKKIIDNTLRDFRLAGADLEPDAKQRFKQVQQELATLGSEFQNHVLDATGAWDLRLQLEEEVAGLPDSALEDARRAAGSVGIEGWRFTLDGPSYQAFVTYADRRDLRRRMYEAYVCRASDQGPTAGQWDNGPLIARMLTLRHETADLLGYANFGEYSLASKMARNVEEVLEFLEDLAQRSKPAAQTEFDTLQAFARERDGIDALQAWDVAYYSEKLREQKFAISREALRSYFPVPQVLDGLFAILDRLYGMRVRPVEDAETWHPDVQVHEIEDEDGKLRGRFYLDLYARTNKRSGAWMDDCIARKRLGQGVQLPVAFLVCNFSAPPPGRPALLAHDEVTTLFHEFGHGLHHLLTRVDYVSVSGINGVAWDAVELPSQFMENWCWEREALDLIGRHVDTGEPIPDELFGRMRASRNFHAAMQMVRQLEFALFDMRLHSEFDPAGMDTVQDLYDRVRAQVAVVPAPAFSRFQNGFMHIFSGGYAAGYYSYKWAEVLSADAFSRFEENGIFDRRTGLEFLQAVLEQGGSRDAMELFIEFRGREPRIDALLRHAGLAA